MVESYINRGLIKDVERITDNQLFQEPIDVSDYDEEHLSTLFDIVSNMDKEEVVTVVAAAVIKYPIETYQTLALYATRKGEVNERH